MYISIHVCIACTHDICYTMHIYIYIHVLYIYTYTYIVHEYFPFKPQQVHDGHDGRCGCDTGSTTTEV